MITKPILHVEDEENDIFLVQLAFQKAGVRVPLINVRDGESAIDYLAGRGRFADRWEYPLPGLVLLDLNLPGKSGIEVLRWLRKQPALDSLVVLLFSSSNLQRDIRNAFAAGANAYLVKPPGLEELVEIVRSIRDFWIEQSHTPELVEHFSGNWNVVFAD